MNIIEEKTDQAIEILNELDIDMWLTYVRKTSELHDPSLYFLASDSWFTWQTALIITKTGRKIAICGRYDVPNVAELNIYDTIISYDESLKGELIQIMEKIDPRSIAINFSEDNIAADGLTHGLWLNLRNMLKNTPFKDRLISSSDLLAALRGRKTAEEIKRIRKAVDISQRGHQKLREEVKLGMTERDLENILLDFTRENNVTVS